ncbi:hypothetical protein [Oceanobacillus alkalisoli]|uniref:hypothetical protein n=1 Tax=Oceanobacillus alkalisoli TaxID=2925113 RepID=UPI001EE3CC18|nr:hypothetical protein [Oceanobacillus alkalisoli]MCG5103063.1 hypothetical protein [Oceanobacillus alkalisoli]
MDENKRNTQPAPEHGEGERRRNRHDEEYAAEFAMDDTDTHHNEDVISTYGWIGIVLSFLSFLIWPVFMGAVGIILGFVSRSKGADTLGNIAIGIGALSIILRIFM